MVPRNRRVRRSCRSSDIFATPNLSFSTSAPRKNRFSNYGVARVQFHDLFLKKGQLGNTFRKHFQLPIANDPYHVYAH